MPITYQRSDDGFVHSWGERADSTVLLFDPVMERYSRTSAAESLGDRVRALDPAARNVDLIILRGRDASLVELAQNDPVLAVAVGAAPTVVLAGPDAAQTPLKLVPVHGSAAPAAVPSLEIIRQCELEALCIRGGAIFRNPHFHYQLPNTLHAEGFIRLGDALHDPVDVTRIADWVLPHMVPDGILLADTGSILALVQEIARRLAMPFECLEQYPPDRLSVERRFYDLQRAAGRQGPLNLLVSVTSSGRLVGLVQDITAGTANLVTVFDTRGPEAGTPGTVLARIPIARWTPNNHGECQECSQRQLMPIASHSYECSPGLNWRSRPLALKDAEGERPFWEVVDVTQAATLHVSQPFFKDGQERRRHFGVHLDVSRLLGHAGFRESCKNVISSLKKPDVVLIPRHSCATPVETLIKEVFPQAKYIQLESARLDAAAVAHIRQVSHVLVADDAIVSGGTLGGLRIAVYRATQDLAHPPTIQAFAVVARPDREADLKAVGRPYRSEEGPLLAHGSLVYLPEKCPWCEERELLTRVFDHLTKSSKVVANKRIQQLDVPLTFPFLLGVRAEQISVPVTRRSFFGELSHVTAFASCSSAIQRLRNKFLTYRDGGIIEVADVPMIIESYFETVFPSAVLRTSNRSQLWNPNTHDQLGRDIERIDIEKAYPGSIAELGIAAAFDKVPRGAVVKLIERALSVHPDECLSMLLEVIKLNNG